MYKIFLTILLGATLSAELVGGVAVVVKGNAITLSDIKKEMQTSKKNVKSATDVLIRKALENQEIKERKISVSSSEVYDDIKKTAARNKLTLSKFYEAVRDSNGLTSEELKEKIKEKKKRRKKKRRKRRRRKKEKNNSISSIYINTAPMSCCVNINN